MKVLAPVSVGLVYSALNSLVAPQHRRPLNAIVLAGAGAAYLSGGLGRREVLFTTGMTYVAFRGLSSWRWIGAGWLLHTAWDVLHHQRGHQILPFAPDSSLGCAICDPVIAAWCFAGGPSVIEVVHRLGAAAEQRPDSDVVRRRAFPAR